VVIYVFFIVVFDGGDYLILFIDFYGGIYWLVDKVLVCFGFVYDFVD